MQNITNEKITAYFHTFYQPVNDSLGALRKNAEARWIPVIQRETEDFLRLLLTLSQPRRILEIGTAVGYSAAFFAAVLPEAQIVTLEREEELYREATENIEKLALSKRITCLLGDATETMAALFSARYQSGGDTKNEAFGAALPPFDFLFLDAAKSHYEEFLLAALPLLADDATVVSDNILMQGKTASPEAFDAKGKHHTNVKQMRGFLEWITSDPQFDTSLFAIGDGIAVSRLK